MFIYKITNKINGKIYVGQTCQNIKIRWNVHISKRSCCRFLKRAIDKYGSENFMIEEIDGANSHDELNYKEWLWIHRLNSLVPNGYNLIEGGKVRKQSIETRLKRSQSMKGFVRGTRSNEHSEKIACQLRGRKQTPESIEKRSKACSLKIIDSNGIIYNSIREAANLLNCFPSNISANLSGKSKHCRHLTFKYL